MTASKPTQLCIDSYSRSRQAKIHVNVESTDVTFVFSLIHKEMKVLLARPGSRQRCTRKESPQIPTRSPSIRSNSRPIRPKRSAGYRPIAEAASSMVCPMFNSTSDQLGWKYPRSRLRQTKNRFSCFVESCTRPGPGAQSATVDMCMVNLGTEGLKSWQRS